MKRKLLLICAGTLLTTTVVHQALAVTSSGTIGATLTLTNGCLINGSPTQSGINFGTLDFGTHPATFSTLTTQLSGASGGNTFTVQCTTASYTVAITGNTHSTAPGSVVGSPGTPERYLVNTANAAQGVAYSLYSDSGFNSVIANNTALPIASTAGGVDSYTLYGRITGGGNSVTVVTTLHKVLQNLLEEKVPIRDMRTILETLAEHAPLQSDPHELTAVVRVALGRAITQQWFPGTGEVQVIGLDTPLERLLLQALQGGGGLEPGLADRLLEQTQEALARQEMLGAPPVLLVNHALRPLLSRFLRRSLNQLVVLSNMELSDNRHIRMTATIGGK